MSINIVFDLKRMRKKTSVFTHTQFFQLNSISILKYNFSKYIHIKTQYVILNPNAYGISNISLYYKLFFYVTWMIPSSLRMLPNTCFITKIVYTRCLGCNSKLSDLKITFYEL